MYVYIFKTLKGIASRKKVSVSAPEQNSYRLVLREANILPAATDDGTKNIDIENTKLYDLLLFKKKKKDRKIRQKVMLSC